MLAGFAGGLAVASVAGARRTETAFERYREATGRSDALLANAIAALPARRAATLRPAEVLRAE